MKQVLALSSVVLLVGFSYCGRHLFNSQSSLLGQYKISANDNSGRLAFTGTISLTSQEQNHLKGRCAIKWEQNARLPDEDGGCEGLIEGTVISIDSAPSMDDAGLLLDGQFNDGRITGTWRIDGFATSPPLGKFEAVKNG